MIYVDYGLTTMKTNPISEPFSPSDVHLFVVLRHQYLVWCPPSTFSSSIHYLEINFFLIRQPNPLFQDTGGGSLDAGPAIPMEPIPRRGTGPAPGSGPAPAPSIEEVPSYQIPSRLSSVIVARSLLCCHM